MNDQLVEKLESFLEGINEDNYEDETIELYEQDVIEILKWKNTAKEIIAMLKNGTRHCENCDSNWAKGCRCCRMTFVGLIQERYGVEDEKEN